MSAKLWLGISATNIPNIPGRWWLSREFYQLNKIGVWEAFSTSRKGCEVCEESLFMTRVRWDPYSLVSRSHHAVGKWPLRFFIEAVPKSQRCEHLSGPKWNTYPKYLCKVPKADCMFGKIDESISLCRYYIYIYLHINIYIYMISLHMYIYVTYVMFNHTTDTHTH